MKKELNQKDCEACLNELIEDTDYILGDRILNDYAEEIETLQQLIEEHFDNSPLKFEELHEGMWVWDNNDNKYNKIIEINNDKIGFYYITNSPTRFTCTFEENRFYRKEVEE